MSRTTIDLLRHGEVDGALCLGKDYDAPLNSRGWSQLRAVLPDPPPWSGIVSSPLSRCAAFAREVAERYGLVLKFEPRFCELGFGAWEGRAWAELYEQEGERLLEFQRNPSWNPAPGGEHYPDFERRVAEGWEELLETSRDQHWLLVSHGGTLRAILRGVLEFPASRLFQISVPHGSLSRIRQDGVNAPSLIFHGGRL